MVLLEGEEEKNEHPRFFVCVWLSKNHFSSKATATSNEISFATTATHKKAFLVLHF